MTAASFCHSIGESQAINAVRHDRNDESPDSHGSITHVSTASRPEAVLLSSSTARMYFVENPQTHKSR
ncbi:hypothetical protein M405DRAFT_821813, partial [Rhizopogon salebrosus TDB-379]